MIRLIAAIDRKRGIAKQGFQPWYIPDDEAQFAKHTKEYGGDVLTGHITYKTLHGPLVDRQNFVLTRDKDPIEGASIINDLEKFLKDYQDKDLWVIGGANVFSQVIDAGYADELYITHIEADFGCNQFFPTFEDTFQLVEKSDLNEQNGFIFTYATYKKK